MDGINSRRRRKRRATEEEQGALEALVGRLETRLIACEAALAAREPDVYGAIGQPREPLSARAAEESDLRRREQQHEERVAMVTKRELELARRAAELEARERPKPGANRLVQKRKTVDNRVYGSCVGDSVAAEPSGTMPSPSTDGRA